MSKAKAFNWNFPRSTTAGMLSVPAETPGRAWLVASNWRDYASLARHALKRCRRKT